MHFVNLIAKRRALQVSAKRLIRAGGLGVIGALGLATTSTGALVAQLRVIEKRAAQMEQSTNRLRPSLVRIERAQRTRERYADLGRFYLQSRQSQDLWTRWLGVVLGQLPARAWITSLDTQQQSAERSMVIDGRALAESDISDYLSVLVKQHELLRGQTPRLEFIRVVQQDKQQEVCEFRLVVPLVFGEPAASAGAKS